MNNQDSKVKPFQSPLSKSLSSLSPKEKIAREKKECIVLPIPKEILWYKTIMSLLAIYAGFKHNGGLNYKHLAIALLFPEIYLVYIIAIDRKTLMA
jgi:hypothetical protein